MDEVAEKGVAAHWAYKGVNAGATNVAPNSVYVFTPTGDLRRQPLQCVQSFYQKFLRLAKQFRSA